MSRKTRSDLIKLAVLWVAISIIGEAGTAYLIGQYPTMTSRQGLITAEAIAILLWITVPVFVLVALLIVYSMIRFRVADDDRESSEAQYRTGRAFPWAWVTVSTVLNVLFIFYPGVTGLSSIWSIAEAATEPLEVEVTASQWEWAFSYPQEQLAGQSELVVPVDRPVRFALRSKDVIHSFWVPAWGLKREVIPGQMQTLVVTPTSIVDTAANPMMRVQCSQICGAGHAEMRAVVRVVSQADFTAWVEATRGQPPGMEMPGMEMPGMEMPGMDMPGMDMPQGDGMKMEEPDAGKPSPEPTGEMPMPMGEPPAKPAPDSGEMPMDGQMDMEGQN